MCIESNREQSYDASHVWIFSSPRQSSLKFHKITGNIPTRLLGSRYLSRVRNIFFRIRDKVPENISKHSHPNSMVLDESYDASHLGITSSPGQIYLKFQELT